MRTGQFNEADWQLVLQANRTNCNNRSLSYQKKKLCIFVEIKSYPGSLTYLSKTRASIEQVDQRQSIQLSRTPTLSRYRNVIIKNISLLISCLNSFKTQH